MTTASSGGSDRTAIGTGWKRFGPAHCDGEARRPQTGSVSTRTPSISSSTVECPSHVARSPVRGFFSHEAVGFIDGSGAVGTRRLPSNRNALNVGAATLGFSRRGSSGCMLRNASPAHSGDALIRSRRNPSGLLPIDFMNN